MTCPQFRQEDFYNERLGTTICSVLGIVLSPLIVFSNGLVLVSVLRTPALRIPTNILICLLALSDLLVGLIFLPLQTGWLLNFHLYKSCYFYMVMIASGWTFCFTSFLSVVAVSCERYVALFQPLKYASLVTITRVQIIAIVIWSISILMSLIVFLSYQRIATVFTVLFAILGLALIVFIYYRIVKLVRQHRFQIRSQQPHNDVITATATERAHQRKLATTMGYAIGIFLVCYAPIVSSMIITIVQGTTYGTANRNYLTLTVYTFSCLCNPIIYCGRTGEIKTAVSSTITALKALFCVSTEVPS